MHLILFRSLGTYCFISFAIISTSACQISSNHEGLNLELVRVLPLFEQKGNRSRAAYYERRQEKSQLRGKSRMKVLLHW